MNSPIDDESVSDAIILAAGLGSRLGDMTQELPKCMIEVGGRSILSRTLECLEAAKIRRAIIVTGYLSEVLEEYARQLGPSLELDFVHNVDYATTNNIYSLWLANNSINRDFYLLESDLIFDQSILSELRFPSSAAVSPLTSVMDGTVLTIDKDRVVKAFYLKNDSRPAEPLLKTINIYRFSLSDWRQILAPRFKQKVETGQTNVYYEAVFAEAVHDGELSLNGDIFSEELWIEIDTLEDFERAKIFSS